MNTYLLTISLARYQELERQYYAGVKRGEAVRLESAANSYLPDYSYWDEADDVRREICQWDDDIATTLAPRLRNAGWIIEPAPAGMYRSELPIRGPMHFRVEVTGGAAIE